MPTSNNGFFSTQSNAASIRRLLNELHAIPDKPNFRSSAEYHLTQIIQMMLAHPEKFDEFCTANTEWIGVYFMEEIDQYLRTKNEDRPKIAKSLFASAFRFLCEIEFTQPSEPSFEVRRISDYAHEHIDDFEGTDKQQLIYAAYSMPAQLARRLITHPAVNNFKEFQETIEKAKELKNSWDSELTKRQNLLSGLAENLKRVSSEYNFVGLVNGFKKLQEQKILERHISFASLCILGFVMLLAPVAQVLFVMQNLSEIEDHKTTLAYSLPTIITIEIILLYFFRVVLSQFRSVKAQLLQIDLRISLCQFIESYAEYASNLREKDSSALEKFEALIFSGLVSIESGIPSTFDGIDQIANLIKGLRGDGKP